jgi:hypothetical protein
MSIKVNINIARGNQKVKRKGGNPQNLSNFEDFSSQFSLHSQFSLQIKQVKEALSHHLKPFYLHFRRGEENLTFKAIKRGSSDYHQLFIKPKFKEIREKVEKFLQVKKTKDIQGWTNGLLITYTYDCDVGESWIRAKKFSKNFKKVIERLRYRDIEIIFGVRVQEAQGNGKAHHHLLIILSEPFEYRFDPVKKRGYILKQKLYNEFKKIFNLDLGFIDIQAITNHKEAVGYLSKYFSKNGEIETLLDKEVEHLREDEIKRLLGLYFMILFRLRQFSIFGSQRRLDKSISNKFQKVGGWERLQGEALGEWIEFLKGLGLGDLAGLGIKLIRGSPESKIKIIF